MEIALHFFGICIAMCRVFLQFRIVFVVDFQILIPLTLSTYAYIFLQTLFDITTIWISWLNLILQFFALIVHQQLYKQFWSFSRFFFEVYTHFDKCFVWNSDHIDMWFFLVVRRHFDKCFIANSDQIDMWFIL